MRPDLSIAAINKAITARERPLKIPKHRAESFFRNHYSFEPVGCEREGAGGCLSENRINPLSPPHILTQIRQTDINTFP